MKYCKKYLYYSIFKTTIILFAFYFVCGLSYLFPGTNEFESKIEEIIYSIIPIIFLIISLLVITYVIISYFFITYEVKEKELVLKKGIVLKKIQLLTYENINAVNIHQGIIMRLFGISMLSIDSGCFSKKEEDEIIIYETSNKIKDIEKLILSKMSKTEECLNENKEDSLKVINYQISLKDILANIFCSVSLFIGLFIYILVLLIFNIIINNLNEVLSRNDIILYNVRFNIFIIFIISFNILEEFFRLYNFKITDEGESIRLQYGLFIKRDYAINKERVRGIIYKQDLVKKKYEYVNVYVDMVGLGNFGDQNEKIVNKFLLPICKYETAKEIVSNIFPDYKLSDEACETFIPHKKSLKFFILLPITIETICFISLMPLFDNLKWFLFLLILWIVMSLIILFTRVLSKKHQMISCFNDKLCIKTGSIIIRTYVVKIENIICLEEYNTFLRDKNNISSIKLDYYGGESSIRMLMYDKKVFEILSNKIKKMANNNIRKDKKCLD